MTDMTGTAAASTADSSSETASALENTSALSDAEKSMIRYAPLPLCIVSHDGRVTAANSKIENVFVYDGIIGAKIYALTGIRIADIKKAASEERTFSLVRNSRSFDVHAVMLGDDEESSVLLTFVDVTVYERLRKKYEDQKEVLAIVHVDNFDELTESVSDEASLAVASEIDKILRQWGEKTDSSLTRYKDDSYYVIMENQQLEKLKESKFSILDEVRQIDTENDFPVTISIGIGMGGNTPAENESYSTDALDLALGRGGDQVVIRNVDNTEYYGGKTQTVEKTNKGKSRIIAHALKHLMEQADHVIIMGHKGPDMDSFGAAVGVYRFARLCEKEAFIVINDYNEGIADIYQAARETEEYNFITSEKAIDLADADTLVIVVDTNRQSRVECPELLDITDKIVVLDHHRKATDFIEAVLEYTESYASSASELVTEIIQYAGEKKLLSRFEAEALLAGITVDTNRFAVKTGVRTFEAASWLRRSGADTTEVKRYFQSDMEMFKTRAACIANAEFTDDGVDMSICPGENINAQIVNSQVADELLTIKGIQVSFVAGRSECGETVISARSLGGINVQTIMEQFGGGGHLTTAGAQVEMSPEEAIEAIAEKMEEIFSKEKQED